SADSIRSDMLRQEIADAYALSRQGRIRIYPVRLAFDGALPYDLGAFLNPLQYDLWKPGDQWAAVCRRVLDGIRSPQVAARATNGDTPESLLSLSEVTDRTGAPLPAADPRLDTGAVALDSPFYVQRTADDEVMPLACVAGRTVLIK